MIGVYYRPSDQSETVNEAFYLQLQEALCSQALVLLRDFNHPDICCRQSRRLLECIQDNFLSQVIDGLTRGYAVLDLLLTHINEPIGDIRIGGCLGCSDHVMVGFTSLKNIGQAKSKIRKLNFRKANFQLFRELVNKMPWETVLKSEVVEQSWQIFKEAFLRAQELSIPRCRKSGKEGKRPAWLNQDLLVKLKSKKRMHRQWKQGQVLWEEYKEAARLCRDGVRKAKAQLELNLARDAKKNKKGFYRYLNQKGEVQQCVPTLVSDTGRLVTTDKETVGVLNNFFCYSLP